MEINTIKREIKISEEELKNEKGSGGLSIAIPEVIGSPTSEEGDTIFIESYEGNIKIHIWNGEEDPQYSITLKKRTEYPHII